MNRHTNHSTGDEHDRKTTFITGKLQWQVEIKMLVALAQKSAEQHLYSLPIQAIVV